MDEACTPPSDYRDELTEEEELFHLEKEEKEGRVLTEELMSSVVLTINSGPFSDDFMWRKNSLRTSQMT